MNKTLARALVTGVISCIWLFGGFLVLSHFNLPLVNLRKVTGLFGLVILFAGVFYGIKKARNESGGSFTYLQAVKTGLIVSVIVGVLISIVSFCFVTLDHQFTADMLRSAEDAMKQSGASPEAIAKQLDGLRRELSPLNQLILPLVAQTVMGTIFSLIISIFMRSKK